MVRRIKGVLKRYPIAKKERRAIILIVSLSMLGGTMLLVIDHRPMELEIERGGYGTGEKREELEVRIEGEKEEQMEVVVGEQEYTKQEQNQMFKEVREKLDQSLLGANEGLDSVTSDLQFVEEIAGYPITIKWQWSPYSVLEKSGKIQKDAVPKEGILVEIKAKLKYLDIEEEYIQNAMIYPPIEEKLSELEELDALIKAEEEGSREAETFVLPKEVDGKAVRWSQTSNKRGIVIIFLGVGVAWLLLYKKKREAEIGVAQIKEQMMKDYPEIVNTFVLYMGAGMTVKNAWGKIVGQYMEKGEGKAAYEELKTTYTEMKNGVPEIEAYERFGNRCDVKSFRRFINIVVQNVKMGTKGMTVLLEFEAKEAFEERKARAKTLGERAGTKMLMPMFLMLTVVLIILVVPAFLSIQV